MPSINTFTRKDLTLPTMPNYWDVVAFLLVCAGVFLLGWGARQMATPYQLGEAIHISLDPHALPHYALRSVTRMLISLSLSLVTTFVVGTVAARSRYAERLIIPLIDILQSVPVLGFLSVSIWAFVMLFPHSMLGPELAAIVAIFTSQVWNMILSLYQSLRTVPADMLEVSRMLGLSAWQRFWRVEVPFALPGLLWNTMLSLSAGWFFVVASEAITVAKKDILLPGIGSYIAVAVERADMQAISYALIAMLVVILAYDQFMFRPMMKWANKFRPEDFSDSAHVQSWLVSLFMRTRLIRRASSWLATFADALVNSVPGKPQHQKKTQKPPKFLRPLTQRSGQILWGVATLLTIWMAGDTAAQFLWHSVTWQEVEHACFLGLVTACRIFVLIALSILVWLPVGVWIGLRPRLASTLQPVIQFLAAFPANLIFPLVVMWIVRFKLNVNIWTSPLIVLGTQWYILFNVIAGTMTMPKSLLYAVDSLQVGRWLWWRRLVLPATFPYLVTGSIAAVGGAWNASILAEYVTWGPHQLQATGLGAYIAEATAKGHFPQLALGIVVMCVYVLVINRLLWKPLYDLAERRFHVEY